MWVCSTYVCVYACVCGGVDMSVYSEAAGPLSLSLSLLVCSSTFCAPASGTTRLQPTPALCCLDVSARSRHKIITRSLDWRHVVP